ncbi:P-loop domain-containing protein [Vibrio sp. WJH972]
MDHLISILKPLEKQNFRAYQKIKGQYEFGDFSLIIDHVQADPYASSSRFRSIKPWAPSGLGWLREKSQQYQIAARDYIARHFAQLAHRDNALQMASSGQVVLNSTSVVFTEEGIELRFRVNLPAEGRDILGKKAVNLLTFHLPKYIRRSTSERELDIEALERHCEVIEDQAYLREQLAQHELVAFVANGSLLPRTSGNSDTPMKEAILFQSPESMQIELDSIYHGKISGMGIKKGITLIVGGGFHGKSTLLTALQKGIYNHIPGDGREFVVTDESAVKIRAEDGRCVHELDISNYINHLPLKRDTHCFSTQDASGSTSQAAWLQEALEANSKTLLIDEDTSATNFMIRDERMQALVNKGDEPITPLVDRIGQLKEEADISTIIVMGGSGDYLDLADCVIQMHDYNALDLTDKAKQVVALHPSTRTNESEAKLSFPNARSIRVNPLEKLLKEGKYRVSSKGEKFLRFGAESIDLTALEQLESNQEINAIGWLWFQLVQQGQNIVPTSCFEAMLDDDWYARMPPHGDLAKPRSIDILAALNRLRKAQFLSN